MRRWVVRIFFVVFFIPGLFSSLPVNINIIPEFYNTVFMVIGIFYSIGYSIALGFDYSKIGNKNFAEKIRSEVKHVIHSFTCSLVFAILLFAATTVLNDGCSNPIFQKGFVKFSIRIFLAVTLVYILIYLVYNFFNLQKLKDDLDDKIREDNNL